VNGFFLVVMQPYLMRLSRTVWLSFFVKYDKTTAGGKTQNHIEQGSMRA